MTNSESWEFLISEYVDRTISPGAQAEIETRLKSDPDLVKALLDYQQINRLLKSNKRPLRINWPELARHISSLLPVQRH